MFRNSPAAFLVLFLVMILGPLMAQVPPGGFCPSFPHPGTDLGLSPEQEQAVAEINRSYQARLRELRARLLEKRLEFKAALGSPQVEEQSIRNKAEELRRLWSTCQEATTEYYLKIRAVLTPDQWQKWLGSNRPCYPWNSPRKPDVLEPH